MFRFICNDRTIFLKLYFKTLLEIYMSHNSRHVFSSYMQAFVIDFLSTKHEHQYALGKIYISYC